MFVSCAILKSNHSIDDDSNTNKKNKDFKKKTFKPTKTPTNACNKIKEKKKTNIFTTINI